MQQLCVVPGLLDEPIHLGLVDRADRQRRVPRPGEHDPQDVRVAPSHFLEQLDPGDARHLVIADQKLDRMLVEKLQGFLASFGGKDGEACFAEHAAEGEPHVLFVVDHEDGARRRRGRSRVRALIHRRSMECEECG